MGRAGTGTNKLHYLHVKKCFVFVELIYDFNFRKFRNGQSLLRVYRLNWAPDTQLFTVCSRRVDRTLPQGKRVMRTHFMSFIL